MLPYIASMKRLSFAVAVVLSVLVAMPPAGAQTLPEVMIFNDDNFQGASQRFTTPVSDLRRWNMSDSVSSIVVLNGYWRFCDQTNFGGPCITLGPGRYPRLSVYNMNDKISSLAPSGSAGNWNGPPAQTGPGWNNGGNNGWHGGGNYGNAPVILFDNDNFQGPSAAIYGTVTNLKSMNFNDITSSIIVRSGRWIFCDGADFGAPCVVLGPGQYNRMSDRGMNDKISSVRPY